MIKGMKITHLYFLTPCTPRTLCTGFPQVRATLESLACCASVLFASQPRNYIRLLRPFRSSRLRSQASARSIVILRWPGNTPPLPVSTSTMAQGYTKRHTPCQILASSIASLSVSDFPRNYCVTGLDCFDLLDYVL